MLQQTIEIPRPALADNETVITALETAAVFRKKGDAQEAMRWLRRAAESAGEAGDDARALALSRSVADLTDQLQAARETPPPLPTASSTPPPLPTASSTPPRLSSPPPLPVVASAPSQPSSPPRPSASSAPPRPSYSPPPSSGPSYPTPPSSRPRFHASTPMSQPPTAPSAAPSGPPRARRVAIAPSPTQPGVFEVRPLAEGEAPRPGSGEAFLVMVDPQSTLLSN